MPDIDCSKLSGDLAESTSQVFQNMLGLPAVLKEHISSPKQFKTDVSVLIGLTGAAFNGTVTLHCSEALATQVTSNMLGSPPAPAAPGELSDEIRDAVGEMANIVVGNFKTSLSSRVGEAVRMTVPSVIAGRGHTTCTLSRGTWLALVFAVEDHTLTIEFSVQKE